VATEHEVLISKGAFGNTLEAYPRTHMEASSDRKSQNDQSVLGSAVKASQLRVNSFHNQQIAALGDGLEVAAHAEDGRIEALQHESKPVAGVMWHPDGICEQRATHSSNGG